MSFTIKAFASEDDLSEIDNEKWEIHYGVITHSGALFMLPSNLVDESVLHPFKVAGTIFMSFDAGAAYPDLKGADSSVNLKFDNGNDIKMKLTEFQKNHPGVVQDKQKNMAIETGRNCDKWPSEKPKGCGGNLTIVGI